MKNLFVIFLMLNIFALEAQRNDMSCRLGFSYEFSNNKNWGKDKPVIMKVYPNSPAELAGIRQNDIIEKIDDWNVSEISADDVDSLLTASESNEIALTVRNFADSAKVVYITKECYSNSALSESQLATAFAMYSVESTHDRLFICPFTTNTTEDAIDFSKFKTFDFTTVEDSSITKIEIAVNNVLKSELTKKGLQLNAAHPDILIHTYYAYNKNPNFRQKGKETEASLPVFRYDITRDKIIRFPFYNSSVPESESEYILQLGIRFIDQRYVPGRILWECEANELMSAPFAVDEYAAIHIPLMCMQFPYVKYSRNVQFILMKKAFNFTGIRYSIYRLNEVASIEPGSPAAIAGIRPHDIIDRIENKRMDHTTEEFTEAYHQFITNTLKYRDEKTRFTDASGFPSCMYWDKLNYAKISKVFGNDKYMTAFAYLYAFESYINPTRSSTCTFYVRRGKEKIEITIRPVFYSEKTIELN